MTITLSRTKVKDTYINDRNQETIIIITRNT